MQVMNARRTLLRWAVLGCAVLAGCAATRSEVKLTAPAAAAPSAVAPAKGKVVAIRNVKDERVFEQAPTDASVPSLGFEGAAQATDATKARAIGRKRNGFGKAMGDVLLQDGQTVIGVVRDNLAAALRDAGYLVVDASAAPADAVLIDVHVKTFWAWLQPGFWAITANANIGTDLDVTTRAQATTISVHFEDTHQVVTDSTWIETIDQALKAYRAEAARKLGTL